MVIDGQMHGQVDKWMDRQMDGWIKGLTNIWTMFLSYTVVIVAAENDGFPTNFAFFSKA